MYSWKDCTTPGNPGGEATDPRFPTSFTVWVIAVSHESSPAGLQTASGRKAGWQRGTANQWREPKGKTFWEAARAEGQQQGASNPSFRCITVLHPDFTSWLVRQKKELLVMHLAELLGSSLFFPSVPTFLHENYREATEQAQAPLLSLSEEHPAAASCLPVPSPPHTQRTQEQCWCSNSSSTARDKAVSAFLLWTLLSELIVSDNNMIWVKSFQQATLRYKCVNISTKVIFIHLSFYSFLTLESILQWNKQILFSSHPLLVPARDWL